MEKKYRVTIQNIQGVDVTFQSNDFDKIVRLAEQLTKEPQQLEGKPNIVYTKS